MRLRFQAGASPRSQSYPVLACVLSVFLFSAGLQCPVNTKASRPVPQTAPSTANRAAPPRSYESQQRDNVRIADGGSPRAAKRRRLVGAKGSRSFKPELQQTKFSPQQATYARLEEELRAFTRREGGENVHPTRGAFGSFAMRVWPKETKFDHSVMDQCCAFEEDAWSDAGGETQQTTEEKASPSRADSAADARSDKHVALAQRDWRMLRKPGDIWQAAKTRKMRGHEILMQLLEDEEPRRTSKIENDSPILALPHALPDLWMLVSEFLCPERGPLNRMELKQVYSAKNPEYAKFMQK